MDYQQELEDFKDICDVLEEQGIIDKKGRNYFTKRQFNKAWRIVKRRRVFAKIFKGVKK